ncbi:MAG TPA: crosslink repair DNA glycosylase YcaQ family protein [Geminicoccaceae bacterium]|nr:crosslink repair DNA glycosylase YcaQ family protein [Geminicoccaceae bacterium]
MALRIAAEQARRLVLSLQGLADPPRRKLSADGLLALIERLGFVQVDSVNVVARAHHMILFARNETYRPALLQRLLEREARLFENWTHDAAIIPTSFYPYWQVRFERDRSRLASRYRRWFAEHHDDGRIEAMLDHIRQNGPVMARDFGDRERPSSGFWDWHPDKVALEFLWRTGRLTIARRQGFQKVYDLAERVIPAQARARAPSHDAFVDWACHGALERLGFATPAQIAAFWGMVTLAEARQWCAHPDRAVPAVLEPADGSSPRPVFAHGGVEGLLRALPESPGRVRVLSPFDPLLRDRRRLLQLFDFDYRIEIFVPASRRRYGYCVFPLLEGDRLIGRIDMKANAARKALEVAALWLEPGRRLGRGRRDRLDAELDRIRRFVGADAVHYADGYLRQNEQKERVATISQRI